MFGTKKCKNCGNKVDKEFEYCPSCGKKINTNSQKDWGILGKSDLKDIESSFALPFGISKIFNTLIKSLGNEIKNLEPIEGKKQSYSNNEKMNGISISISTSGNNAPKIKINSLGKFPQEKKIELDKKITEIELISRNLNGFSKKKKSEPETNVRRFSDRIVYEIIIPGVKNLKDISITKLDNGIEIKAISKKVAYEKTIPINLPIIRKDFSEGRLILEMDSRD
jgi:hypothetical protein